MATNKSIIQARYDKAHTKNFGLKFNLATDADIIEKLSSVPNIQAYIKQVIRQDIARTYSPVPVSMCDEARALLQEEAAAQGKDVCELAKLIINEWLIRQH